MFNRFHSLSVILVLIHNRKIILQTPDVQDRNQKFEILNMFCPIDKTRFSKELR